MQKKHQIFILALSLGFFVWGLDALVDYFFFYEEMTLFGSLFVDVPVHEIYMRLISLISFFIFGIVVLKYSSKSEKAKEALKKAHAELEQRVMERTAELRNAHAELEQEVETHKKLSAALLESEARFKGIFEYTKNGVAVYQAVNGGKDFIVVDFNKGAEKIESVQREVLIGNSVLEIFPGVKEFGLLEVFQRVWRTGNSEHHPVAQYKDQRIQGWRENFVYKLPSGEIVAVYSDETKSRQAEEALKESRDMLQVIFDGVSEPLILRCKDASIKMMNKAANEYYQVSSENAVSGDPCFTIFKDRSEPCENCSTLQSLAADQPTSIERKGCMDATRTEQVTVYPVKQISSEAGSHIIHIRDITIEKQVEQELIQADKMISLGILVSGVAHEINNPNNFIMLNAPLLKEVWESVVPILNEYFRQQGDFITAGLPYSEMIKEVPNLLNGIEVGSRRIQRIVKDLNDYSRRNEEKIEESVRINDIVQQAASLVHSQIKKSTQRFSVEYGQNLPEIKGHSQKLEQVMINLIQNACQALSDTKKSIHVATSCDEASGDIVVTVQDEGAGIPDNVRLRIWDPFFTTRRDSGGVGLGLAVSSNIIKEHGGKLEVRSEPAKGSTFIVHLPVKEKKASKKILVVDDDSDLRKMITTALSRYDMYSVIEAANGTEASIKLGIERPDLVILDIQMPDLDGVEICRFIKTNPALAGIRVIIITGFPDSEKVKEAAALGFENLMSKPFKIPVFLTAVDRVLN